MIVSFYAKQRERKPNLFGLCRVSTEEGEVNAAWGGQWDAKELMIAMDAHATTENLRSAKAERSMRATSMPLEPTRNDRSALAERKKHLHAAQDNALG